jgi:hypothetical protein|tara:strand:+ start:492 stop:1886 length:1395 start_codon:yes stop_codon:yes gene_type:complete
MAQEFESQFKPIVSGSDYLSGSEFGQVAGALLARRDKQDKDKFKKALFFSILQESLGTLQRNQKQGVIDSINDLQENYTIETASREAEYNSDLAKENRNRLRLYEQNPQKAITELAREFYNNDDIISGRNMTFEMRGKIADPDVKKLDTVFYNKKLEDAKNFFEQIQDNPMYSTSNFLEYNKVYHDEYKAALNVIKDDPTKKSLFMAAVSKIFPERFDATKADLDNAFDNAENKRKEQETSVKNITQNERLYTKEEALDYVVNNFSENVQVSDKLFSQILNDVNKKPNDLKISENEIFGIALSRQVLNPDNLNIVQKEVNSAIQLFNASYTRKYGDIPAEGSENYQDYLDAKNDYLDINVFKVDPTTSQINRLLNELENVEEGSQQEKALLNQLNKYTVDEQTESILRTTLVQIIDVESRRIIEADISQENQLDTPRFTNLNEWFAFTVKAQKDAVDYYKNQLD